jgi:hypothetical protein
VDCWIGVGTGIDRRVVSLAGRLSVAHVPELLEGCGDAGVLELDLSNLVSVDVPALETLQRLRSAGANLVGAPGYIQLKLDSPTATDTSPSIKPPKNPGQI